MGVGSAYGRDLQAVRDPLRAARRGCSDRRAHDSRTTKIDEEDPPKATTQETSWGKLLSAAAVQGVIFKMTRVVVDRYGAVGFNYLTGVWPGEKRPDPDE